MPLGRASWEIVASLRKGAPVPPRGSGFIRHKKILIPPPSAEADVASSLLVGSNVAVATKC